MPRGDQGGDFLSFLSIPSGTAYPGLRHVNWIYGYGLAGAATQPVGNYVSMFRVTVIGDSLTADREVTWKAIANIRGV